MGGFEQRPWLRRSFRLPRIGSQPRAKTEAFASHKQNTIAQFAESTHRSEDTDSASIASSIKSSLTMTIDPRKNSALMSQREWLRTTEVLQIIREFNNTEASKLYTRSIDELGQGNSRAAINLSWKAFKETPRGSYLRFHVFQHHCRVLIGSSTPVSLQDMIYLQQVAQNVNEETLCRVEALQVLEQLKALVVGDVSSFVWCSKFALEVAHQATPKELKQKIFLNDSYDVCAGDVLEEFTWRCTAMLNVTNKVVGSSTSKHIIGKGSPISNLSLGEETKMDDATVYAE